MHRHSLLGRRTCEAWIAQVCRQWLAFRYEGLAGQGNQPFFQLDEQVIARGYHISITDHGGIKLPFRVASVECVHNLERAA